MSRPKSVVSIGPLGGKASANIPHYSPPKTQFTTPTYVCAATSREPLKLQELWRGSELRPGCQQFRKYSSIGGC